MPIKKQVDASKDITIFICNDEISFDEFIHTMIRFYQGIDDPPTKKVLWDLTSAIVETLSIDDIDNIAQLSIDYEDVMKDGKTAVVAPHDINFGLARMFEAKTAGIHRDIRVFRTMDDAKDWIGDIRNED